MVRRGDLGLERGQLRVPSVPHVLGTPGMPPPHVVDALLRQHLGHLLLAEGHGPGPGAQQLFQLGFGKRRHGMEPGLGQVCDLLALAQAMVAHEGDGGDATPALALVKLRSNGAGIGGMAWEHCESNRLAVLVAE